MDGNTPETTFRSLLLITLRVWSGNPRKTVGDVSDLTASVAKTGVLEALLVRPVADGGAVTHEILAGQRRFLAASAAGLVEVPCMVRDVPDDIALELGLVENSQRTDPSPLEEAEAIDRLVREHGRTREHVADKLGRPVRWVEQRLALLALVDAAKQWMRTGRLPLRHALQLCALDVATQDLAVTRFANYPELPSSRAFAMELKNLLHSLVVAPFNVSDETLPGGGCARCVHRSDAQVDLFDTGHARDAFCLNTACWQGKIDETWARAQRDAEKHHLKVITDPSEVFSWGEQPKWNGAYETRVPEGADLKPVAIARDQNGKTHTLYDGAAARAARDEAHARAEENDEETRERDAKWKAQREAAERDRQERERLSNERIKQLAQLPIEHLIRLAVLASEKYSGIGDTCAVLGLDLPEEDDRLDAWVASQDFNKLVRALLVHAVSGRIEDLLGGDGTFDVNEAYPFEVKHLAPLCPRPGNPEPEPPAPKGKKASKKASAAVVTPAESVTSKPVEPAPVEAPPAATATVRVWIRESEWDVLPDDAREDLEEPIDGHPIDWQGTAGFVWARVSADELLVTLRGLAGALLITLHEGEEPPPPPPPKPSKKGSKKAAAAPVVAAPTAPAVDPLAPGQRTLRAGDAVWSTQPDAQHTVTEIDDVSVLLKLCWESEQVITRRVPREWITLDAADLWRLEIPALEAPPPAAEAATVTLRVKRGDWLLHRSELRDSAGAVLHKRWEPVDQDRVATVERGAEVVSLVVRYCTANNIALWLNDVQMSPKSDAAPAAPAKRAKAGAK